MFLDLKSLLFEYCSIARIYLLLRILFEYCCIARIYLLVRILFEYCCIARIYLLVRILFEYCCIARIYLLVRILFEYCCIARIYLLLRILYFTSFQDARSGTTFYSANLDSKSTLTANQITTIPYIITAMAVDFKSKKHIP